ncbi:potassium-transporting ATPase subunit KdpA [Salinisphaera orenii]|uniref:potassium-transporting ATPase subunit KdpA n=1 Tax=Salinisphaera orenii TaxID=856731 RepID=UPI000DBE0227
MNEIILTYVVSLLLALPLGWYMANVFASSSGALDRVFGPVEQGVFRLAGIDASRPMDWKGYALAFMKFHVGLGALVFFILYFQGYLPLNPDGIQGMDWDLALHTATSFLTNTNQQHYSGQAQLSYFAHMFGIVTLQVITPTAGLVALVAIVRTLLARPHTVRQLGSGEVAVGNFYRDLVRAILRITLPLAFLVAILIAWQGVPSTFEGAQTTNTLDPAAEMTQQEVPVGPVASMVAIKQLGTNGGGWYGPNSSVPLENPTPVSNFIETVSLVLIPIATVIMAGFLSGRRRLAAGILSVMVMLSVSLVSLAVWSENQPNAAFVGLSETGPNMEGKETRFGPTASALWGAFTTQTSNGSVNSMHDSWNPMGGLVTLMDMFINAIFGGVGVGLINFLLYGLLAAFLGSLMIGRSPAIYGRALEAKEIKLLSIALLLPSLLILSFTGASFAFSGLAQNSNPAFHGISQVLYEYTSAFANNGSGFEGLGDDTVWWNVTTSVNLVFGRFIPIVALLAIGARIAGKRAAPTGRGSLKIETPTFAVLTLGVIVLIALLSFMPVLVLGPIGEQLFLAN